MLLVASVIHLLPVSGVLGGARLEMLYGISFDRPDLTILMRHRAVLFGILGLFLLVAAFRRSLQPAALTIGIVSVVSFIVIAWTTGGYNAQIERIVTADIVALVCLVLGIFSYVFSAYRQV